MVKTKIEKAAFIGLGVMGYPMAGHLAKSGFSVMVYNRTKSKADRWVSEFGGRAAATPERQPRRCIVFLCVGNDNDVRLSCLWRGWGAGRHDARRHSLGRHNRFRAART